MPSAIVIAACLISLALMPEDTLPPGALRWPGIVFSAGLLAPTLIAAARGGFAQFLRIESAIGFSLVFFIFLDIVQGLYSIPVPPEYLSLVFVAVTIFVVFMYVGASLKPPKLPGVVVQVAARRYSNDLLVKALLVCFALGIFYFLYCAGFDYERVIAGLTKGRFSAPWARGGMGGWTSFIEHLSYFGYLLAPLTVLIALNDGRWMKPAVFLGLALTAMFLPFVIQGGGRRILGVCLGGALFTWLCAERNRLRIHQLALTAFWILALVVIMDMMLHSRSAGSAMQVKEESMSIEYVRVDDNFLRFAQMLEIIPAYHPHTHFHWLLFTLARPIPRVLWPGKPVSPGFDLARYLDSQAVSLTCSTVAEFYVAFSWLGVVVGGFFYGRLARFWSQLLEYQLPPSSVTVYSMGLMAVVVSIRGFFELILMSYPLLAWLALNRILLTKESAAALPRRTTLMQGTKV